jgi:predicted alpha/beta hydrolase family esterase
MLTLILPGYSAKNKLWAEETAKNLKAVEIVRPLSWDHWEDETQTFKPKEKADLIVGLIAKGSANLIAKSVGTLVAAYVVEQIPSKIEKIILCGVPSVSEERLEIFKKAFSAFPPDNIICFQNEGDPFVKPEELTKFMNKVNPKIKVGSMPRRDHHYPYYEEFNKFLS